MSFTRRQLLAAVGSASGIALAGCLGGGSSNGSGSQNTQTPNQTTSTPTPDSQTSTPTPNNRTNTATPGTKTTTTPVLDGPVATAPLPDDPSAYTYATMGTRAESKPVITYFGNWKCPVCRRFSVGLLRKYVTEYIKPGKASLRFRSLAYGPTTEPPFKPFLGPDADRAARAGLIIWHIEPESYWSYHEYVFANQPPEYRRWATVDRLVEFAKEAGVKKTEELRAQLKAKKYQQEVKQTAIDAAKAGVTATPQLLINGQVVSPFKWKRVQALLNQAGGNTMTGTQSTNT
jgi:protein-disulfide isomerase